MKELMQNESPHSTNVVQRLWAAVCPHPVERRTLRDQTSWSTWQIWGDPETAPDDVQTIDRERD
jgi:hypothetical protein